MSIQVNIATHKTNIEEIRTHIHTTMSEETISTIKDICNYLFTDEDINFDEINTLDSLEYILFNQIDDKSNKELLENSKKELADLKDSSLKGEQLYNQIKMIMFYVYDVNNVNKEDAIKMQKQAIEQNNNLTFQIQL